MIKVVRILCAAVLLIVLAACGGWVKFKNASLYEGDRTQMISGPLATPKGEGPFPAVVLLHSCGGLSRRFIVDWPHYLTGLGYVTLSVDSFGPRGIGRCPHSLDPDELTQDAYGGLEYLASLPFVDKERIGVMGFSMGARTIDYFAQQVFKTPSGLNFKAAVSLYGSCANLYGYTFSPVGTFKIIPTMVIVGELEKKIYHCRALVGKSPHIKVYVLLDTYHAFDNERHTTLTYDPFGNPMLYSEKATIKARELTKAYLAEHLGKR